MKLFLMEWFLISPSAVQIMFFLLTFDFDFSKPRWGQFFGYFFFDLSSFLPLNNYYLFSSYLHGPVATFVSLFWAPTPPLNAFLLPQFSPLFIL